MALFDQRKKPQAPPPVKNLQSEYVFQASSPAEDCINIAKIHHREANQLFVGAAQAEAEGRAEEAKLLLDLAVAREGTALEFEKAAKGETGNPIVTEILDWQEDLCNYYVPHTTTFVTGDEPLPEQLLEELKPPEHGRLARAVAWVGSWISHE